MDASTYLRNVGTSLPIFELIIRAILPTERTQGNTISYVTYSPPLVVVSKEIGLEMAIELSTVHGHVSECRAKSQYKDW